ncbi:hypothetical protein EON67_11445 [archaeon]|nr:MAG: hypothetical protein EON67_11445 [archaeon]
MNHAVCVCVCVGCLCARACAGVMPLDACVCVMCSTLTAVMGASGAGKRCVSLRVPAPCVGVSAPALLVPLVA